MIKILVFLPRLNMKEQFEKVIQKYKHFSDIKIELIHVFGTPKSLGQNEDADIFIARGMTHDKLKEFFPKKHIVEIQMTSFDILDALIRSRNEFQSKKIALCVHNIALYSLNELEEVCDAKIDMYDVKDEDSAKNAIEIAQTRNTDTYIGAGTVCGICDEKNLQRVHIKTKNEAIEIALSEAINTAITIKRERIASSVFRTIINHSSNGIITINNKGIIQQINNQAYHFFNLSTINDVKEQSIDTVNRNFKWKQAMDENGVHEEVLKLDDGRHFFIQYTPILVDTENNGLVIIVKNSEDILKEETKIRYSLREKGLTAKYSFNDIIGKSDIIKENIKMANKYSKVDSNVLIIGETGTGKELFAHSIYQASNRSNEPFVAINCAALPENLLESELFGYEAGSFSGASRNGKMGLFELAHKGTIFLDEIGEIPMPLQAKLLRVLQEHEIRRIGGHSVQPIDVRVISATNINIEKQIEEGKFRSDLYYRLNLLDIYIPPLRERKNDIQEMVDFYLSKFSCNMKKSPIKLTKEAAQILSSYSWPGNVRELRNICERLVVLNDKNEITKEDLKQFKIFQNITTKEEKISQFIDENLDKKHLDFLKPKKKKQDLAKELGVSRTTLWRMLKQKKEDLNKI